MIHVSLTRLRVRSLFFMPLFGLYAARSNRQVQHAPGFLNGSLLPDDHRVFWTMTAWDSPAIMRAYMRSEQISLPTNGRPTRSRGKSRSDRPAGSGPVRQDVSRYLRSNPAGSS